MQKWEYMFIGTGGTGEAPHVYSINFERVEQSGSFLRGFKALPSLTQVLADLGEQGWELVTIHYFENSAQYTFKRPKQG